MLGQIILIGLLAFMPSAADMRLADAAMHGNKGAVQSLLQQKADVNAAQGDGTTALHWAAYREDLEMARLLVKAGADVKATTRIGDMTPLYMAAKTGNAAMVELLLNAGSEIDRANANGTTPLMVAAAAGKADAVKVLLDRGANVNATDATNGQTALMFASALNRDAAIKLLATHGAVLDVTSKTTTVQQNNRRENTEARRVRDPVTMGGNTALLFAAREGNMEAVKALVEAGADVNKVSVSDNMPPITQAIVVGHFDVAKYLLDHGANPNLVTTASKMTPLWATIDSRYAQREWYPAPSTDQEKTSHLELMTGLLDKGAEINAKVGPREWFRGFGNDSSPDPDGSTAFWRAAAALDMDAMKLLLQRGADPKIDTKHGSTALQVAAGMHHSYQGANQVPEARMTVIKFLVEEIGIDVNAKDDKGYTALHGAALIGNNDVIQYLVDKGADITLRAESISGGGDGGGEAKEAPKGKGDTVADMANGWSMNYPQYPETVTLLMKLGSDFSNTCWASTCVNPTRPDKAARRK
jgi:ankyrin repeat protein